MSSQALGLAEASGLGFLEKRLDIRFPWRCLPPMLWPAPLGAAGAARLEPPWPDFVIACGRNAAMPALAIRRASGGHTHRGADPGSRGRARRIRSGNRARARPAARAASGGDAGCRSSRDPSEAVGRTRALSRSRRDAAADPCGIDRRQQQGLSADARPCRGNRRGGGGGAARARRFGPGDAVAANRAARAGAAATASCGLVRGDLGWRCGEPVLRVSRPRRRLSGHRRIRCR